ARERGRRRKLRPVDEVPLGDGRHEAVRIAARLEPRELAVDDAAQAADELEIAGRAVVLGDQHDPERGVARDPGRPARAVPALPVARVGGIEEAVVRRAEPGEPQIAAREARVAHRARDARLDERVADVLAALAPRAVHERLVHAELHGALADRPDAL